MQEQDYSQLRGEVASALIKELGKEKSETIREQTEAAFKKLTDEQKIFSLSDEEVGLLLDFRSWKCSNKSASGVYHFKL